VNRDEWLPGLAAPDEDVPMRTSKPSSRDGSPPHLTSTCAGPVRDEILTMEKFAQVVGLRGKDSARAARDFIRRHGVPHIELSRESWFVLHSTLVVWMRGQEGNETQPDIDAIVDEMVSEDEASIENVVNGGGAS
jgi:hypothetical protein